MTSPFQPRLERDDHALRDAVERQVAFRFDGDRGAGLRRRVELDRRDERERRLRERRRLEPIVFELLHAVRDGEDARRLRVLALERRQVCGDRHVADLAAVDRDRPLDRVGAHDRRVVEAGELLGDAEPREGVVACRDAPRAIELALGACADGWSVDDARFLRRVVAHEEPPEREREQRDEHDGRDADGPHHTRTGHRPTVEAIRALIRARFVRRNVCVARVEHA